MKFCAVVLLLTIGVGCSDPDPISPSPVDGTITLVYLSTSGNEARLLLSNNTETTVRYLGFGASSPLQRVEFLSDTGWVTSAWDWCGTGALSYAVGTRASVTIITPISRVGVKHRVLFGVTAGESDDYRMVTSNEFVVP